jgi:4-hydroxy-tetrahydrodipicolinate synthase
VAEELAALLPVIADISAIRLDEVIALGRFARRLGLPGVVLMAPHFYPMSQADLLEFFLRAADGVDLPICLYNFPELTSNRIGLETVAAFADRAAMAGIKQRRGVCGVFRR